MPSGLLAAKPEYNANEWLINLYYHSVALPAAAADAGRAVTASPAGQLVCESGDDTAAADTDGMPECDGTTVHIHVLHGFRVEAECLHRFPDNARESLINFEELHVFGLEIDPLEGFLDCICRVGGEIGELTGTPAIGDDRAKRIEAQLLLLLCPPYDGSARP